MENMHTSLINREEFTELINLYHRRVLKKALCMLDNPRMAADVVQNTYLKAWINRHSLLNKSAFGRWIEIICQHECWRVSKKEKFDLPLQDLSNELAASEHEELDNGALYSALSTLPEADIEIVSLKYYAGYSQRRIALLLGVEEKTVKSRLFEARKRLKKSLGSQSATGAGIGEEFMKRRTMLMDTIKRMDLGAYCIPRMSLAAQRELLASAEHNEQFSEKVLAELAAIDQGRDLAAATDGRLNQKELMEILACCDQPMVNRLLSSKERFNALLNVSPAGYVVEATNAILHTLNMGETVRWFENTLAWHGGIDARDEQGNGTYGCLLPDNPRAVSNTTRAFEGIHMFRGEPTKNTLVFVAVRGLDALRQTVLDSGWKEVDAIEEAHWGARVCHVTTPEGYVLKFFESI